jgi:hypothetical protein
MPSEVVWLRQMQPFPAHPLPRPAGFIGRLYQTTTRTCFFVLRCPVPFLGSHTYHLFIYPVNFISGVAFSIRSPWGALFGELLPGDIHLSEWASDSKGWCSATVRSTQGCFSGL